MHSTTAILWGILLFSLLFGVVFVTRRCTSRKNVRPNKKWKFEKFDWIWLVVSFLLSIVIIIVLCNESQSRTPSQVDIQSLFTSNLLLSLDPVITQTQIDPYRGQVLKGSSPPVITPSSSKMSSTQLDSSSFTDLLRNLSSVADSSIAGSGAVDSSMDIGELFPGTVSPPRAPDIIPKL